MSQPSTVVPTRALVLASLVPLTLGVAAVAAPVVILPMLAIDLVIALVALIDLLAARGAVEARREVAEVQAVGRPFDVSLHLTNVGPRALSLRVTDDAPGAPRGLPAAVSIPVERSANVPYQVAVESRGRHPFGPVTVRWLSPLGLWERQRRLEVASAVRVYPAFGQLRRYGLKSRLVEQRVSARVRRRTGGENEFERLRPYVSGDSYRHIDWKATARKRDYVTREYRQESNQNLIFLLDCGRMMSARAGDLTAFDHALNAAAMLGQTALRQGDRVGLLAFDTAIRAWLPPKGGARSGGRLIRATYDLFPSFEEPDYALAFRHLGQRVRRRSLVVLLTSVVDEVNASMAEAVLGALGRRHLAVSVWLRDPELDALLDAPASDPAGVYARAAAAELVAWRERSLAQIRRRGALVVDCPAGELTPALLGRYLEIKSRRLL